MNLLTGEIVDIYVDGGSTRAKVRVGGAYLRVPLTLLMDAKIGDRILVEAGVAIARVEPDREEETAYVPRHPR